MGFFPVWKGKVQKKMEEPRFMDMVGMHQEIRKAHLEWTTAQQRLEWVVEKDQIDYAIFALEAAEKRYVMLLRQAKLMQWEDGLLVATRAQHLHSSAGKGKEAAKRSRGQAAGF